MDIIKRLHNDSLFRNSFYLILATAVMAGFGFFFWLISTHLANPKEIGIATTLISVMNIISIFSLIGFDSAIVRFLPNSDIKNEKLNTGIILVGITALLLGTTFIIFVDQISPQLSFIKQNTFLSLSFIAFCVMSAINILTDAVFLSYRQTKFSLIINTVFSFVKMLLPLAFFSYGAFGIFSAAAVGQSIGFILSIFVMIWKFDYKPKFTINLLIIKEVWKYCTGNYFAGVLNMIPPTILPIIITNHLGPEESAYFYIVMMIGNLLYVIPQSATRSLFAEGSNDESSIEKNIIKSIKMISIFLIPAIIVVLLGGKLILDLFGKSYTKDGLNFLYIIAISAIAVSFYSISNSIFRIKKSINSLITINAIYTFVTIGLSYLLFPFGLLGIGISWLIGNLSAGILGVGIIFKKYKI